MKHSWGTIFRNALGRGEDHGYAAHLADEWEKRGGLKLTRDTRITPCNAYRNSIEDRSKQEAEAELDEFLRMDT